MSEEEENETVEQTDRESAEHNSPRGNPETDQEAVDKGVDTLERVKPY